MSYRRRWKCLLRTQTTRQRWVVRVVEATAKAINVLDGVEPTLKLARPERDALVVTEDGLIPLPRGDRGVVALHTRALLQVLKPQIGTQSTVRRTAASPPAH